MSRTRVEIQKDVNSCRGYLENMNLTYPTHDVTDQIILTNWAEAASDLSKFEQELAEAKARGETGRTQAEIRDEISDLQSQIANHHSILDRTDSNSMQWAMSKLLAQQLQCNINALQRELNEAVKEDSGKEKAEIEKIEKMYAQEISSNSNKAEAYKKRALDFFGHGITGANPVFLDRAIADFTEAIRLDPHDADAYVNRAGVYSQKGDLQRAIADYDKAIQIDPNNVEAYSFRGMIHSQNGKYDQALNDLNKAIQLDPKYANAHMFRAAIYFGRSVFNKEKADYDKAIQDISNAITDSEEALRLEPDDGAVNSLLSNVKNEKEVLGRLLRERQERYDRLVQETNKASTEEEYQELARELREMDGYKDATVLAAKCDAQYRVLKGQREEQERIEKQRQEEEDARKAQIKKTQKKIAIAAVIAAILILAGFIVFNSQKKSVAIPASPAPTSSDNSQQSQNSFQATHKVVTNDGTNLRLRDAPGFDSTRIGSLDYGSSVRVLEIGESAVDSDGNRGNWTHVSTPDGKTGWCFGAYLQVLPQ